jgi:hypothetical protein
VRVVSACRWPTPLTGEELRRVTGLKALPAELAGRIKDGRLDYFANGEASFAVRGAHARVKLVWNYEAPAGAGDTHTGVVRGSLSRIEVLQGAEQKWQPELYVVPNRPADAAAIRGALARRIASLALGRPGLAVLDEGTRLRVVVPDRYRVGHEPHFAEVTERFLGYLKDPATLPAWEAANMLAKYRVTTEAVELSRR